MLAALVAAVGCGDDEGSRPKPRRDAGEEERDAAPKDASSEPSDAAVKPDTGSPEEGLSGNCAIDSNKIFSVSMRNQPFPGTPLAVDPVGSLFALPIVGTQAGCLDVVNVATMSGSAQGGEPSMKVAVDACALIKDAVAVALRGQWFVAMVDSREPPFDVWLQAYDPVDGAQGSAVRVQKDAAVETALAVTSLRDGERGVVAWGAEASDGTNSLYTRVFDRSGALVGEPQRIDQSKLYFRGLSLAPLGEAGAALAYWRYDLDFKVSEIVFRPLDADGKPTRDEWVVAAGAGPSASVDVATDARVGGIVYSRAEGTQRQVWFQRIDATGQAAELSNSPGRSAAQRVVGVPKSGIDVSVTKLVAGYLISYRALPTAQEPKAAIRLVFLDRSGQVIGDSDVSYTSESGGRTAVEAAYDGRVVIGWSQVNADGKSELKLVRLPCIGG